MGRKQLVVSGRELIKILEKLGFLIVRVNGSHYRLKHLDGRATTIPVHGNDDLPKGLLRKIIKEDLQLGFDEFYNLTCNI